LSDAKISRYYAIPEAMRRVMHAVIKLRMK
jgi:hypothetical protein